MMVTMVRLLWSTLLFGSKQNISTLLGRFSDFFMHSNYDIGRNESVY